MASRSSHNKNNSAVKRILQEARELANDPSPEYRAAPLEEDIFEWHCTIRGPAGTEFEGGLYHCRILLPAEYPFRPPAIMLLTPSGRFELNTKICISFTNYHEESWQPAWGVRTAIIGLQGFFPLKGEAAIGVGALEYPTSERKRLAKASRDWTCPHCQVPNLTLLPDPVSDNSATSETSCPSQEELTIASTGNGAVVNSDAAETILSIAPLMAPSASPGPGGPGGMNMNNRPAPSPGANSPPAVPSTATPVLVHAGHTINSRSAGQQSQQLQQQAQRRGQRKSVRPPLWLDGAIAVLLILVAVLLSRRISAV